MPLNQLAPIEAANPLTFSVFPNLLKPKQFTPYDFEALADIDELLGPSRELDAEPTHPATWITAEKKKLQTFAVAKFHYGIGRSRGGIKSVSGFVADIDDGRITLKEALDKLPFQALGYSSPSHTIETPKSRVIVPFSEPIQPEDYRYIFEWFQEHVFEGHLDPSTKNPDRIYFFPGHLRGVEPIRILKENAPRFNPQPLLEHQRKQERTQQREPTQKIVPIQQPQGQRQDNDSGRWPEDTVKSMLEVIPSTEWHLWWKVGNALKAWGTEKGCEHRALELFHQWSERKTEEPNYDPQACDDLWEKSDPDHPSGNTIGSLVRLAQDCGWKSSATVHALFPPLSDEELAELDTELFVDSGACLEDPQPNPKKLPPDPGATGDIEAEEYINTEPEILLGAELQSRRFPRRDWLISNLMQEREMLLLHAPTGLGKTWFSLSLAIVTAGGGSFLRYSNSKPRRVLLVDGEMDLEDIQNRINELIPAVGADPEKTWENLRILSRQGQSMAVDFPDFGEPSVQRQVAKYMENENISLLVLDNFSTLVTVEDENSAAQMRGINQMLLRAKQANRAAILVHHSNKNGGYRGSSAIAVTINVILRLEPPDSSDPKLPGARFKITYEKVRGLLDSSPYTAHLNPHDETSAEVKLVWDEVQDVRDVIATVVEEIRSLEYANQSELAKAVGKDRSTISRWIKKAEELRLLETNESKELFRQAKKRRQSPEDPV